MKKIPVLIIEDNRLLRESIKTMIEKEKDFVLLAACESIEKIPANTLCNKPFIILLELGQCNQKGLETVKSVKAAMPDSKIIIMNLVPKQEDIFHLVSSGVSGFILKDAAVDEFISTLRIVFQGEKVLPSALANILFAQIIEYRSNGSDPPEYSTHVNLTLREKEVIHLVAEGLTNKEIAQRLHLSSFTIKSHIHNILRKLALRTRMQIAKVASMQ